MSVDELSQRRPNIFIPKQSFFSPNEYFSFFEKKLQKLEGPSGLLYVTGFNFAPWGEI
jgi:hypothetical protein